MTRVTAYVPADADGWTVFVRGDRLVAVAGAPLAERVSAIWAALDEVADAGGLLDQLLRDGLAGAPPFAIMHPVQDGQRVAILRGPAVYTGADGSCVDGRSATTWVEQRVSADGGYRIRFGDLDHDAPGAELPIISGVVRALAVEVGMVRAGPSPSQAAAIAIEQPPQAPDAALVPAVAPERAADPEVTLLPAHTAVAPQPQVSAALVPEPPEVPPVSELPEEANPYDHLFGATVVRNVEDAAVRSAPDGAEAAVGEKTVVAADIAALRAQRRAERAASASSVEKRRAAGLVIRAVDGASEPLDGTILIGRAPTVSRVSASSVPRLITVASQDVSRNHVQIELAGESVVVTDLESSNGTWIEVPGQRPRQLRPKDPTTVIPGTTIDLGDGVRFVVEVAQ